MIFPDGYLAIEELRLPAWKVTQLDDWRFSLTVRAGIRLLGRVMGHMRVTG